jgi:RHS repeat-associated protein
MFTHTTRTHGSRVELLSKLSAFLLIFLLLITPLAPIFAQEVAPITPADPIGVTGEEVTPIGPDKTDPVDTNPVDPQPPTKEDAPVDPGGVVLPIDPTPKVDVPTPSDEVTPPTDEVDPKNDDPQPESLSASGGFMLDTRDTPTLNLPQVDQSQGSLSYSYPITIPPGRNGLQPDLALTYSSQAKDVASIFGYGWSLNIPYIERVNKTGVERLYTDDYFTSSTEGELVNLSGSSYAPKTENGNFLSYDFNSTSSIWTVKDKKGTIYTYGLTSNSLQDDGGSLVYKWMLEEVRDTNDNYITYHYAHDNGQLYPDVIKYTSHGTANDGIFEVFFSTESRTDILTQNMGGFPITTNYRINKIEVKVNSVLVHQYDLAYIAGHNTQKSLLETITESGIDSNSTVTPLPPVTFTYSVSGSSGPDYVADSAWTTPASATMSTHSNYGAIVTDLNKDSLPDLMESFLNSNPTLYTGSYLNNGDGTWTQDTNLTPPVEFSCPCAPSAHMAEEGIRTADFNGDAFPDLMKSSNMGGGYIGVTYLNSGTAWNLDTTWPPMGSFFNNIQGDSGNRLFDINGDGLDDFVYAVGNSSGQAPISTDIRLNNGAGWTHDTTWNIPVDLRFGAVPVDYNGDGLMDFLKSVKDDTGASVPADVQEAYRNNGDKSWSLDTDYTPPVFFAYLQNGVAGAVPTGVQFGDINADGLVDILAGVGTTGGVHLNKGSGWEFVTTWGFGGPLPLTGPQAERIADFDGDGMLDRYESHFGGSSLAKNQRFRSDLLTKIETAQGGESEITYKTSPKYVNGSGGLLNPNLPYLLDTVYQITTTDPAPTPDLIGTTTYSYEGGEYFYNSPTDRKFAGFHEVTKEDNAGNITKTYFHQGNADDTASEEENDSEYKIGKIYRVEQFDNSNNPYRRTDNRWDEDLTNRNFVYLGATVTEDYDGSSSGERSKAEEFTYNNSNGNLEIHKEWGEAGRGTSWSINDTGTDDRTTTYSYISPSSYGNIGLPYNEMTIDNASTVISETAYIYDGQSSGYATLGNITGKDERISSGTYANTTYGYGSGPNPYGMIETIRDPNGNTTTYAYDSYYLYPLRVTDGMNYDTFYTYDYSAGKVIDKTDPNNNVWATIYDGLGRVLEEKIPAPASSQVSKTNYAYDDNNVPNSVTKTDHLNGSLDHNTITYVDGFGRTIQTRSDAETDYNVADTIYDGDGRVFRQSLPYVSSGTSHTADIYSGSSHFYSTYTYDPLDRITSLANAVGTTTYAYDDWNTTVTDANTHPKDFYKDAYGNLIQVDEHDSTSTYSTFYTWNMNGNLLNITDAAGNVRNFTYNNMGWRTSAEDLHDPLDTSFGTWVFDYFAGGQIRSKIDPFTNSTYYAYDGLNRVTTEDYSGYAGTEITYTYDSCYNGIGHLCNVDQLNVSAGIDTDYVYDVVGNVSGETKTLASSPYTTAYTYDYQGNLVSILDPYTNSTDYTYNIAGLIESITHTPNGGSANTVVSNFDYSPMGQMTVQNNANGVDLFNDYDATLMYRLKQKQTKDSSSNYIQDITYAYDPVGNVTDIVDASTGIGSKTSHYTYDDLDRLVDATVTGTGNSADYTQTFRYDAIGNRQDQDGTIGYAYDGNTITNSNANPHAATTIGSATYTYDAAGNFLGNGNGFAFYWNYKNQLDHINYSSASSLVYKYDHTGQRVSTDDGWNLVLYPNKYFDADVTYNRQHIYAGSQLIATIDQNGTHYTSGDHLTGTNLSTDAGGAQEQLLDYYPFGAERINTSTTSFDEKFKFTGKHHDDISGMDYFGARYYNSGIGRFISEDPAFLDLGQGKIDLEQLSNPQTLNSYSYAGNNPITNRDPNGKCFWDACIVEAALAAGMIATFAQALMTPLGQYGLTQAGEDFKQGKYGWAAVGALTSGEFSSAKTIVNGVETTADVASFLNKGNTATDVYLGVNEGKDVYVGISKNTAAREAQHGSRFSDGLEKVTPMPTRNQARAIEQTIIDNKSGTYQNKINSISPNNPIFNGVKEWGNNFLNQLGLGKNLE